MDVTNKQQKGPSTVPCGTPDVTSNLLEETPLLLGKKTIIFHFQNLSPKKYNKETKTEMEIIE